jgi:hypothetical protein
MNISELNQLRPPKHPYYSLIIEKGVKFKSVAAYVGIKPNRLYQIMNGHTTCPAYVQKRLDDLVRLHLS